jgi:hypothetical protein
MRTLNDADRTALLTAAARLIESRQPARMAILRHRITLSPDGPALFLVRFDFPGVVSVHAQESGALIVRSKRGRPTEPDRRLGAQAL